MQIGDPMLDYALFIAAGLLVSAVFAAKEHWRKPKGKAKVEQ